MDGFFVAKFKKVSNDIPTTMNDNDGDERDDRVKNETNRQRDYKNKHALVEKEEDEDIDMEENDEQDDEEEIHQALMSSKSKKTKFNDEIKGRIEPTKNSTSLKKEHLIKPSSSSSLSNPTKLVAAPALSVTQLGAQIAETAANSRTKNKRLPAERTTPAEIEMQRKISDLVFSKSTSTTSSAGYTSAIMSGGSGLSTLDKKSMKSSSSMRSSSALVNDDEENKIDPSSLGGVGKEEGSGDVFDFLKPGEKIHSKKRKAGKKVAAQKEAKRSTSSSSSSGLKKK
jgi:hypothetical protein